MAENKRPDFFQQKTGKKISRLKRSRSSLDQIVDRRLKGLKSKYPLRLLGTGEESQVWISEEEREVNFHILGAPGEGKSKLLEYHIRKDIDLGLGVCLLDPSEKGDTVNNVLAYCEEVGHKKVILIDPSRIKEFDKVPCIPAIRGKNVKASVEGIIKGLSYLFNTRVTDTRRVLRFTSSLLRILAQTGNTLFESKYFALYKEYYEHRQQIYGKVYGDQFDVHTLESLFRTPQVWESLFGSSINQLQILWQEPLSLMFASTTGINFQQAIRDGWVILVNLTPYNVDEEEAKVIGLMVISQIFQAVRSMGNHKWKGVYYLYIDEAGRFTSPQIKELLTYLRKSGVRLILAHHDFDQFRDQPSVMTSILNGARIKFMMNTTSYDDRMKMIKELGYGGDIPPLLASYTNKDLPKQEAIVRKYKEPPVRIRIPDVPDIKPVSKEYLNQIFSQPFYKSKQQIKDEINARITPADTKGNRPGKTPNRKATSPPPVPKRTVQKDVPKDGEQPPDTSPFKPIKI